MEHLQQLDVVQHMAHYLESVKLLVANGVVSSAFKAMDAALKEGCTEVVQYLCRAGPEVGCVLCLRDKAVHGVIDRWNELEGGGFLRLAEWLDENEVKQPDKVVQCQRRHAPLAHVVNKWAGPDQVDTMVTWRPLEELQVLDKYYPVNQVDVVHLQTRVTELDKVQWLHAQLTDTTPCEALQERVHDLCGWAEVALIKFYIGKGFNIGSLDEPVKRGQVDVVKFLPDECGITHFDNFEEAIGEAACRCHFEVVQMFDDQYSRPYPPKAYGCAAAENATEMLEFLLGKPHDDSVLVEALESGYRAGSLEPVKLLYEEMMARKSSARLHKQFLTIVQEALADGYLFGTYEYAQVLHFVLGQQESLDGFDLSSIFFNARCIGHIGLIQRLFREEEQGRHWVTMDDARGCDDLDIVRFIHEHVPDGSCTPDVMDTAARGGNLELIKYLHENCEAGCTEEAMSGAAYYGH